MKDLYNERKRLLNVFNERILKRKRQFNPVDIPEGLFVKCEICQGAIYTKLLKSKMYVCPFCDNHFRINADQRLEVLVDANSFKQLHNNIESYNSLNMPSYDEKLANYKKLTKMSEAFKSGTANVFGIKIAIGILDSTFMMGSMGSAVGERIARLVEYATENELPLVIVSASGGARMQEGILSLMQMAKTAGAIARHNKKGLLYISIMTNPTTGGVAASFASLGDIIIAEKSSLIGFAGPRVIKQTIGQELPKGFQTDEFQLKYGQVDFICKRINMRKTLYEILYLHNYRALYE